jgi:dipeptidase E
MNRLDARARLVFHYAREEADRLGHAVIESEHLLLGLLREGGIAAQVLNTSGLTLEAARHRVVELIGRFERSRDAPPPAITALARRVMDLAGVEAGRYQSSLITTGHVLLGMIHAGDGVAMGIINQVEGGTKTVRRMTLQALNLPPDPEASSDTGLSGIVAVPADSVLGRLLQPKPEPQAPVANITETGSDVPQSEMAFTPAPVVAVKLPTIQTISTHVMSEAVAEPYSPPTSLRLEPEPIPIEAEPMVTKHPTPVIEASSEPFVEKTPTLDLDELPATVAFEPEDDFPETLLIDEAFAEVPLESESVSNLTDSTWVSASVIASSQTEAIIAGSHAPSVIVNAFESDDKDLIPIEIEATLPEIVQPLSTVSTSEVEPPAQIPAHESHSLGLIEGVENQKVAEVSTQQADSEGSQPQTTSIQVENPATVAESDKPLESELPLNATEPHNIKANLTENNPSPVPEKIQVIDVVPPETASIPTETVLEMPQGLQQPLMEPEVVSQESEIRVAQPVTTMDIEVALESAHNQHQPESSFSSNLAKFEVVSDAAVQNPNPENEFNLSKDSLSPVLKTASWDMVTASSVTKRQIIALGGGGFSQEPENLLLDQYILEHARTAREVSVPRVCFVSTAAGDSPSYIERFYTAFKTLDCEPYHLPLFKPEDWEDELEDMILGADVLYFSGGSTKNALALWKAWELEPIFQQAYEAGTVIAGISAGAICWFEQFTTDSLGRSLGAMEGLGWLPGSFTPHYDAERYRKTLLERLLRARKISPGFAADDGAAVHFINSEYAGAVSSRPNAKAYHVTLGRNRLVESPLETLYLGH